MIPKCSICHIYGETILNILYYEISPIFCRSTLYIVILPLRVRARKRGAPEEKALSVRVLCGKSIFGREGAGGGCFLWQLSALCIVFATLWIFRSCGSLDLMDLVDPRIFGSCRSLILVECRPSNCSCSGLSWTSGRILLRRWCNKFRIYMDP